MSSVAADDDGVAAAAAAVTVTAADATASKPIGVGPDENGGDTASAAASALKNVAFTVTFDGNVEDGVGGDGGRRNGQPKFPELDTLSFLRADDGGRRNGLPLFEDLDSLFYLQEDDDTRRSSSLPRFAESDPMSFFRVSDDADVGRRDEQQPDGAAS